MILPCPYCGTPMSCDEVDIGVGFQQYSPYGCDNCHAVQMGVESLALHKKNPTAAELEWISTLDPDERRTHVRRGLPAVVIEEKEDRLFFRCPACNAWDKALEGAPSGVYGCDECGQWFTILARVAPMAERQE